MAAQEYVNALNLANWMGSKLYDLLDRDAPINEKQKVTLPAGTTGGTFTLTHSGNTTAVIAYNASAATVKAALELLASIPAGDIAVSGQDAGPWTVEFLDTLGNQPLDDVTADGSVLTPSGTVTVETTRAGQQGDAGYATDARLTEARSNANERIEAAILGRYDPSEAAINTHPMLIAIARKLARFDLVVTLKESALTENEVALYNDAIATLEKIRKGDLTLTHPIENRTAKLADPSAIAIGSINSASGTNANDEPTAVSPTWFARF